MLPGPLWLLCLSILETRAAATTSNEFYSTSFSTLDNAPGSSFTGSEYTYVTSNGQVTVVTSGSSAASESQSTRSTTPVSLTTLGGGSNGNASSTSSSARPQNTVPCNGHPELCNRQYSNITQVCSHNSAFAIEGNAGSNQDLPIRDQLNDGIRMLQGGTLWVNDTVMNCHTTCDLLNAGPWEGSLEVLVDWLNRNPYDVVTWLIGNRDFIKVEDYIPAIERSGIRPYLYEPSYVPQRRDQWPTLAEMIISGKRVVMFMDYNANQAAVPYILDQFTHIWETPFSPTNRSFPCTIGRPPKLSEDQAREQYMYLANHNLNTAVDLSQLLNTGGNEVILIPNTADINITNGQYDKFGQLGAMSQNCADDWGRPPNFLVVDYYNYGHPKPGSVFEVAAQANGVDYNGKCCGLPNDASIVPRMAAVFYISLILALLWSW